MRNYFSGFGSEGKNKIITFARRRATFDVEDNKKLPLIIKENREFFKQVWTRFKASSVTTGLKKNKLNCPSALTNLGLRVIFFF